MGQKFIGIRSGLTGDTVIMFPSYVLVPGTGKSAHSVGSVVELRLEHPWQDLSVPGEVLGHILYEGRFAHKPWVRLSGSGEWVELPGTFHYPVDAAMAMLQYLSDLEDDRLHLREYAEISQSEETPGGHRNSRRRSIGRVG